MYYNSICHDNSRVFPENNPEDNLGALCSTFFLIAEMSIVILVVLLIVIPTMKSIAAAPLHPLIVVEDDVRHGLAEDEVVQVLLAEAALEM
jgi:hypothetical protein